MLELFQHIQKANMTLNGSLAFANDWNFFMKDLSTHLENLVPIGPYAGTLDAFATGVKLRTRYEHLLEAAIAANQTSFWTSSSQRVMDTAHYFGAGFFGLDKQDVAHLHVIPESADRGADTLTPGRTCFKYAHNADAHGHTYGYRMWEQWRAIYLPVIARRLEEQNPDLLFSESAVYSMQELCGFETIAKGESEWCDVFTHSEWEVFEYARDLLHYYRTGPGNPYSAPMGWLWLNATANLLREGPDAGPLFFSLFVLSISMHEPRLTRNSVHDGDMIPMLTALKILSKPEDAVENLPTSHILSNRTFCSSDIVPMGGRINFERLACPAPRRCYDNSEFGYPNMLYCEPEGTEDFFVRINVNDGIVALPGCEDGPGRSCPLDDFTKRVERRGKEVGDFREVCGLPRSARGGISFLHQ